jgi:hypothetical protein
VGPRESHHEKHSAGFSRAQPAYTTITNSVYRREAKKVVCRVQKTNIFEPLIARDVARESLIDLAAL